MQYVMEIDKRNRSV